MLVVFPLGLLATSLIFDIVHGATGNGVWSYVAYYLIGAGIIGGLAAALFGFIDWLTIPSNTRAKRIGAYHGIMNVVVVSIFLVSFLLRRGVEYWPPIAAYVLSAIGASIALVSGWLGGELIERLGIGVSPYAGPDAPSSLRDRRTI
jgi:uncharacterized membrane protein